MVTLFHARKSNNDTITKINSFLNNKMNLKQMYWKNDGYGCWNGLGLNLHEDDFLSDFP